MATRYKMVFHYTNGTSATVRNVLDVNLVDIEGTGLPADLLLILDKVQIIKDDDHGADLELISRVIVSGSALCYDLQRLEVFSREEIKRSKYEKTPRSQGLARMLLDQVNDTIRRDRESAAPAICPERGKLYPNASRIVNKITLID